MLKNKVEIEGSVALIHVKRKGFDNIVLVDLIDLPRIELVVKNRLNIDTNGYVQHKKKTGDSYEVFQLHRFIAFAQDDDIIRFKNGNRLDLRFDNLIWKK